MLQNETVFLHRMVHSEVVSLSHIRHEHPEPTTYCYWISMVLLLILFSVLFLVKNTLGWLCGGNCLFAFARAVAYGTKNPPGLKEEKSSCILWLCGHSGTNRC